MVLAPTTREAAGSHSANAAYSLLGDGQIPLNTEGGDREVKSTNTKQCHRMKLAVTPQPRRYEELWHVGLLPQEPHWLRASPGLGGRLVTDSGHTHPYSDTQLPAGIFRPSSNPNFMQPFPVFCFSNVHFHGTPISALLPSYFYFITPSLA